MQEGRGVWPSAHSPAIPCTRERLLEAVEPEVGLGDLIPSPEDSARNTPFFPVSKLPIIQSKAKGFPCLGKED